MTIEIGHEVEAKMAADSFYKKVRGVVTEVRNGWVSIKATEVISKWDTDWTAHPASCSTSAKISNVTLV